MEEILFPKVSHPLSVSPDEIITRRQGVRELKLTSAKAVWRVHDFSLDKLVLIIDQLDIDSTAKRGRLMKRSLGKVGLEPNCFSRGIHLPILMEIDFFLRQLSKVSLVGSDDLSQRIVFKRE